MLLSILILVLFTELWLLSALSFALCFVFYMYKTGHDLFGITTEVTEFALRSAFTVFVYSIVAYVLERKKKQSFMGRESPDKAFHRWMKIFESFPEGIALVHGSQLLYGNRALKFILDVGKNRTVQDDPQNELLKHDLKVTVVEQWVKSAAQMKRLGIKRPK